MRKKASAVPQPQKRIRELEAQVQNLRVGCFSCALFSLSTFYFFPSPSPCDPSCFISRAVVLSQKRLAEQSAQRPGKGKGAEGGEEEEEEEEEESSRRKI